MAENDRIIDMARALARAIQMDERYAALAAARDESDANDALQDAIGRFNLARMNLNTEISKPERDDEKVAACNDEMQRAYDEVMSNESMAKYEDAKNDINKLITYINAILTTAVSGGDPDGVTEPEGCSGGCDGCESCG